MNKNPLMISSKLFNELVEESKKPNLKLRDVTAVITKILSRQKYASEDEIIFTTTSDVAYLLRKFFFITTARNINFVPYGENINAKGYDVLRFTIRRKELDFSGDIRKIPVLLELDFDAKQSNRLDILVSNFKNLEPNYHPSKNTPTFVPHPSKIDIFIKDLEKLDISAEIFYSLYQRFFSFDTALKDEFKKKAIK